MGLSEKMWGGNSYFFHGFCHQFLPENDHFLGIPSGGVHRNSLGPRNVSCFRPNTFILYLVVHPTDRFCGLVHPSKWIDPTYPTILVGFYLTN